MMPRLRDERGFVLSMVIFAVAALSIAGTALFLVVQSENAMANSGAESSAAFNVANAGLSRFMGGTFGEPRDSVAYEMGGGMVSVTATHVLTLGDTAAVYLIEAEAQIPDRRVPDLVSRRAVQQFAMLRRRPFAPIAGLALGASSARARTVTIDGRDQCVGGSGNVAGIATLAGGDMRGSITGSPAQTTMTYAEMMKAIGVDWAALTDRSFAFDYEVPEQAWPRFGVGALAAATEFPTIRVDGDFRAYDTNSGRGLLVVTGNLQFYDNFTWDGAILAGSVTGSSARFTVNGTLLTGFSGAQSGVNIENATIRYNSCKVVAAAQGIAMLSPLSNTWWETAE